MAEGVIGLTTAVIGALFGALATYATQRFFNRARVYVEYAEVAYEDVFTLTVDTQQNIGLYHFFIGYVDVQTNWYFRRLVAANSFNRDELLLLQKLCGTFKNHQSEILARLERFMAMMNDSSKHEELIAQINVDYVQNFQRNIAADHLVDPEATITNARAMLETGKRQVELGKRWLQAFEEEIVQNLAKSEGASGRIVIIVGAANRGLRNSVLRTQAVLHSIEVDFKLPLLLSSRPWESEHKLSPYLSLDSKEFKVLEFGLDEKQNAEADIKKFRTAAKRGVPATIKLAGAVGNIVAKKNFRAELN